MAKKLYARNLSYNMTEDDVRETFGKLGEVLSAKIIMDNETGRSKGFGSVEMANDEDGDKAITSLNGTSLLDRTITVSEATGHRRNAPGPDLAAAAERKTTAGVSGSRQGQRKAIPFLSLKICKQRE